jgi:hypothetical protein
MIKLLITFENIDKEAEDTTVSARFKEFDDILPWLNKVKVLNEDENLVKTAGFIKTRTEKKDVNSPA